MLALMRRRMARFGCLFFVGIDAIRGTFSSTGRRGLSWADRAHGVVVSRLLRMQKALGSNPSGSTIGEFFSDAIFLAIVFFAIFWQLFAAKMLRTFRYRDSNPGLLGESQVS
jgi:hypothetical protein